MQLRTTQLKCQNNTMLSIIDHTLFSFECIWPCSRSSTNKTSRESKLVFETWNQFGQTKKLPKKKWQESWVLAYGVRKPVERPLPTAVFKQVAPWEWYTIFWQRKELSWRIHRTHPLAYKNTCGALLHLWADGGCGGVHWFIQSG